ncbi:MAG: type I restriction-modification enzyme R subunit C-terminal domain-containing protein [Thiolinea sp.]
MFARFLQDQSLAPAQIRFIEMIIDQLTARGVMEAGALYEPPFSSLHAGGPDELFAGRDNVIEGLFTALEAPSTIRKQLEDSQYVITKSG